MRNAILDDSYSISETGKVFAIAGDKASTATMLISLAERLRKQGVLFIDAAHSFNQVFVQRNFPKKTIDLKNIYISRPFTFDQFASSINTLKKSVVELKAKAIVISGFERFILELKREEQEPQMERLLTELGELSRMHGCVTIVGIEKDSRM